MLDLRPLLAVIGVAACAGGAENAPRERLDHHTERAPSEVRVDAPFVVPGEHLLMDLSWRKIPVAQVETAVGEPGELDGRPALLMWSELESDGLLAVIKTMRSEVSTTLDLETGVPIATVGSFEAIYAGTEKNAVPAERRAWPDGERSYDTHAAVALLRAWDPPAGTRGWFDVRAGTVAFRADVVAAGRELLRTRDGKVPAVRIDGEARGGGYRFSLWFADDRLRRPLRMDVETRVGGILRADLVRWERTGRTGTGSRR